MLDGAAAARCTVDGHELITSASIGIALFPHDGDDAETLIKNADTAMYRAKEQGRNHYQFYTDDMNATAFERLMLESRLRKALEQRASSCCTTSRRSTSPTGRVVGVEALLRWRHPDLGLGPAGRVHPARRGDRPDRADRRTGCCATACAQVAALARAWAMRRCELAVNISARQFQQTDLVATIAAGARRHAASPPTLLELELTESVIMRDAAEARRDACAS